MAWELWQHHNNIEHNQENAPRAQEMTLAKREVKPLYQGYEGTVPNEDMYISRNTLEGAAQSQALQILQPVGQQLYAIYLPYFS